VNIFIATVEGNLAILTPEESWHCSKVLRKKPGEMVNLIDGKGNSFEAKLEKVSEKQCTAIVIKGPIPSDKRNYYLHLAIAPTKQIDRIEWMIEKAVEIGLDEISFFISKNSERTVVKTDRIRKIVESAIKQSLQSSIPKVNDALPFKEFISKISADQKLIAHCTDLPKKEIKDVQFSRRSTLMMIGPEGDFAQEEVKLAMEKDFLGINLGPNRLRTETAALYACQAVSLLSD
jgi:16S rRNA (uracil1498-N3)-methyltransferase